MNILPVRTLKLRYYMSRKIMIRSLLTSLRTLKAIARCDIAVVVVDALDGLVVGDLKIANEAAELFKGIIFAYNKWDIVEKDDVTADNIRKSIVDKAPTFSYVPILFISALSGLRVNKVWDTIDEVVGQRNKRVETAELNEFITGIVERRPPPAKRGKFIRIFYTTQPEGDPPTFIFFTNYPDLIDPSYIRYLENRIRGTYDFTGTPIKMIFKHRK